MDPIRKQVRRAHWRLTWQAFGRYLLWSLVVVWLVAAVAIGVRKVWTLGGVDPLLWKTAWLVGGSLTGLIAAAVATWWQGRGELEAAIEVDRRFGLKERVSSSLLLTPLEQQSEFGQALLSDTQRRVARLDVHQAFQLKANRWAWLPLVSGIGAFGLALLVPDASPIDPQGALGAATVSAQQQVQTSAQELKKRLEERREQLRDEVPPETKEMLESLERGVEELAKRENVDKKEALIELNDLAKQLESRREQLGGHAELRQQLNQLANMQTGPAERLASSLKKGDFEAAAKEIQKLAEQLKNGELNEQQKQQLAEQLNQMQQQVQQLADAREQAKQALQEEIQKRMQQGDQAGAEKLQRQLDQMVRNDGQMQKMQQLASKMAACSQAMKSGDGQQAQAQMSEIASQLSQMQGELQELESLTSALAELEGAKQSMNCSQCSGSGCSACQGTGNSMGNMAGFGSGMFPNANPGGMGMGQGRGVGDRPEAETDTSFYQSRVEAEPKGGRAVVSGSVAGPNASGDVRLQIRDAMQAARTDRSDPLEGVHIPRDQRELAREYFELYREGTD